MAQLKNWKNIKLKASSLLEVVIAMTIIMSVFGISIMVYSQLIVKAKQKKKVEAIVLTDALMIEAVEEKDYFDRTFEEGVFKITKTVETKPEAKVMLIQYTVHDKVTESLLWETQKIVRP